jgi:hypothetical protein
MDCEIEFTRSVTLTPCISKDSFGKVTYGTPFTVPACISYTIKNIIDMRGNTFITSAKIDIPYDTHIVSEDKITLPNGSTPYIGSISEAYDEEARKVLYKIVYVGKTGT